MAAFADFTYRRVLLETDIGYGNGPPCGVPRPGTNIIRISTVRGAELRTITTFNWYKTEPELIGW